MNAAEKIHNKVRIEYHADDYGMFPVQSRRILDCHVNGLLNGVSVMPNGFYLDGGIADLDACGDIIAVTVHLNLIEGNSLCTPEEVSLLTDECGVFRISFGKLLLHSFLPDRNRYREQLKKELRAQIQMVASRTKGRPLRLDGHAHYHMIPVVFDALMDVIREEKLQISYIRIPREYLSVYMHHSGVLHTFSFINMAKVVVLNTLCCRANRKYGNILKHMEQKIFMGVFFSGQMYRENVEPVLPYAVKLAEKQGKDLEILAHPGGVYEPEDIACLTNREDISFLTSEKRGKERSLFGYT